MIITIGAAYEPSLAGEKENGKSILGRFLRVGGIRLAKPFKILHLKRPRLFPILDTFVVEFLTFVNVQDIPRSDLDLIRDMGLGALRIAREDIARNLKELEDLRERLIVDLPIPLTVVRLYDIICWTTEKWDIQKKTTAENIRGEVRYASKSLLPQDALSKYLDARMKSGRSRKSETGT